MTRKVFLLFVCLFSLMGIGGYAQDSVRVDFTIAISQESKLTYAQQQELNRKLAGIVARSNASGSEATTPYRIEADLIVTAIKATEGTLVPMTLIQGELLLLAKNRLDGTLYNQLTIPLKETTQADSDKDNALALIRSIKPRDTRFVRFIRTSQKRIAEKGL